MEYVLHRKSNCKKIKIRVVKGVVQVSAPFYVSNREIDDFVKEHEEENPDLFYSFHELTVIDN